MSSQVEGEPGWVVWDWPVRLIHWYFPLGIGFMWWSGEAGHMQWHSWAGYSLLVAGLTRLLWGFFGSYHARFSSFLRSPVQVLAYLRGAPFTGVGHNPIGGWSTLVLLVLVITQAVSGLCASDDISFEGPLSYWAGDWADTLTEWHEVNWALLQLVIVVHIAAITFYHFRKRQPLVRAMLVGSAPGKVSAKPPAPAWRAIVIATFVATLLALVITLAPEAPSYY